MKLPAMLAILSGFVPAFAFAQSVQTLFSDPEINDTHSPIIYSTIGDEDRRGSLGLPLFQTQKTT
jgi:hypothetical protein